MTESNIATEQPKGTGNIILPANGLSKPEFTCVHCGQKYKSITALCSHLRGCKERALARFFHSDKHLVILITNPGKKKITDLSKLVEKFPNDTKVFLSVLQYLDVQGQVKGVHLLNCEKSPEFLKQPYGRIARYRVQKSLIPEDLEKVRALGVMP